jgi:hypothetical protein
MSGEKLTPGVEVPEKCPTCGAAPRNQGTVNAPGGRKQFYDCGSWFKVQRDTEGKEYLVFVHNQRCAVR